MIKSHKQELLSLLDTMGKMADLLLKLENPFEQIQDILAACECIRENLETEEAPKSLELLQTIETSLKENKLNILEYAKKLKFTFDSEAKTKREALFLPYKASMWDSLESIYLAAKDDPNWEAFVMPIPYYDKKNGQLAEMHWETTYPKNIPLIDYRKYNIEERRPDIIFIHNPYDDCNIVTSVHPDFFSYKLRNFTNCLVYVPYFVGNGTSIQKHFCTLPACIFAHKVIVQTEQERAIYVREYKEFAKRNNVPERLDRISEKFLALGSPKLDKAVDTKREDFEIPPEWEKLINNADGTRKKVVFYNTSISALLEKSVEDNKPSNKYLQKVRSVFEFFKTQHDAVLLWRPHPLLEGTITSMRPWLEQEYAEIVSEYKAGKYGIYDDSPDLNRAIALSDIYYGDGSSVTKLFEAVGKPVFGQMFETIYTIYGLYDDGNSVWFINSLNGLYRYNKQNKKTEFIGVLYGKYYPANLNIVENDRKLYFAPYWRNDKICIFDMIQKKFEKIDYGDNCKYDKKFQNLASFKNFVYFIPSEFPAIIRLDTETNKIEYFSQWTLEVSKLQTSKIQEVWKNIIFWGSCVVGSEIAMVIHGANAIMLFNMETGGYEIKNIGEKSEQYSGICFDGQNYYLSFLYKDYVVKWNRQSNKASKIKLPSSFSRKESVGTNFLIQYLNGCVWLIPAWANNAYKINIDTNEITELPELIEHFKDKNISWNYNRIFAKGNLIYASTLNKGIVEYCTDTRKLNFINDYGEDTEKNILLSLINNQGNESSKIIAEGENSGKKIWGYFKK